MRWWLLAVLAGCDTPRTVPTNPTDPATLNETGLCSDARCEQIADDVVPYAPQYALYSDGAAKRRWIALPDGAQIDTTNMDDWRFPVGTRLWKEFTRDGVRVETRYMTKLLDDDSARGAWLFVSFAWSARDDATTRAPDDGVRDANGTAHDIPSRSQCQGCHENLAGRVLGVGAMSLDAELDTLDLAELAAAGLLTAPPASTTAPAFAVPGGAADRAAFGYLHANCGHCHNPTSRVHLETPLELRLVSTATVLTDVPAWATTVEVPAIVGGVVGPIVHAGDPQGSVMIVRMTAPLPPTKMPALGTELIDPVGQDILTGWIQQLP